MIDLNAERKRRAGLADTGRCPRCGHWRHLCMCEAKLWGICPMCECLPAAEGDIYCEGCRSARQVVDP